MQRNSKNVQVGGSNCLSLYQTKDVTPYMHAFSMHVPEFLCLHGNITMFTQQGLEKLNDLTTKYFQRGTNHHDEEALRQILERSNRLEALQDAGYNLPRQYLYPYVDSYIIIIMIIILWSYHFYLIL